MINEVINTIMRGYESHGTFGIRADSRRVSSCPSFTDEIFTVAVSAIGSDASLDHLREVISASYTESELLIDLDRVSGGFFTRLRRMRKTGRIWTNHQAMRVIATTMSRYYSSQSVSDRRRHILYMVFAIELVRVQNG